MGFLNRQWEFLLKPSCNYGSSGRGKGGGVGVKVVFWGFYGGGNYGESCMGGSVVAAGRTLRHFEVTPFSLFFNSYSSKI